MGYQRKTLHITFEDKPGLEVYARSLSVRKALSLMRDFGDVDLAKLNAVPEEQLEGMFGALASRVVSWTLEDDDGTPLPVTLDALMDWDMDEAVQIFYAWLQKAVSVSFPTGAPAQANGTGNPLETSIPMASASGM